MVLAHETTREQTSKGAFGTFAGSSDWRTVRQRFRLLQAGLDTTVIAGASTLIIPGGLVQRSVCSLFFALIFTLGIGWNHGYDTRRMAVGGTQYRAVARGSLVAATGILLFHFIFGPVLPRVTLALVWAVSTVAVILTHVTIRHAIRRARAQGELLRPTVLVGIPAQLQTLTRELGDRATSGNRVVAWCGPEPLDSDEVNRGNALNLQRDTLGNISALVQRTRAEVVIIADGAMSASQLRSVCWEVEDLDVELMIAPAVEAVSPGRMSLQPVAGTTLLSVDLVQSPRQRLVKAAADRVLATLGLLVTAPILAIAAVAIKRDSTGPVFFRQNRIGLDGTTFSMVKLRTMLGDAEQRKAALLDSSNGNDVLFKMRDDPRITSVGGFLRRFSLDELPQLWNVLRGDMSLVGPRPPLPGEAAQYDDVARQRLRVKPGMTGLWQVSGRSDLTWDESVRLDTYYADNVSVGLDMLILLQTVKAVMGGRGAY